MRRVARIEFRERVLDFTSSGQDAQQVISLFADGRCLTNAVSLMTFDTDELQVEICEECGIVECKPGGWICARRLGDFVLWIPCFERMAGSDSRFAPPGYVAEVGVPLFTLEQWNQVRVQAPGFVAADSMSPLSAPEAVRLLQFEAPVRVLGRFPEEPRVKEARILASGSSDTAADIRLLQATLDRAWSRNMTLKPLTSAEPLVFYVDAGAPIEWTPLGIGPAGASLCLGSSVFAELVEPRHEL